MKFSAVLSLGVAHMAVGKSVHKVAPIRREPQIGGSVSINGVAASQVEIAELQRLFGLDRGSGVEINFLWVNVGGGAATTVLNQAQTVTVTQTVNGAAGTVAPIADIPGQVAASPTEAAAASPVVGGIGATHSVTVGGPQGLAFNPPQLAATPGDTVIFTFLSQNHTATQSAFDTPCAPLAGGMDSGFQSNPNNTVNPPPQVAMQVMVDTPLWFYCRQNNHCGKGMTFSINPTADKTHAMFQAMAIAQNGNGGGSAITGGAPAAAPGAPAAAPPAAAPPAAAPVASGTAPNGAAASGVVIGAGTVGPDGTCNCAVTCNFDAASFPASAQGNGNFGGIPGGIPMAAMPAPAARR